MQKKVKVDKDQEEIYYEIKLISENWIFAKNNHRTREIAQPTRAKLSNREREREKKS